MPHEGIVPGGRIDQLPVGGDPSALASNREVSTSQPDGTELIVLLRWQVIREDRDGRPILKL